MESNAVYNPKLTFNTTVLELNFLLTFPQQDSNPRPWYTAKPIPLA